MKAWIAIIVLFSVPWLCLGAQPGNPGQGKIPTGPQGGQGNQGGGGPPPLIPGSSVTDPKALVPSTAKNANRLALANQLTLSELLILRQILLGNEGYAGKQIGLLAVASGDFVNEESSRVSTGGLLIAIDKAVFPNLVLGLAGGYSHSSSSDLSSDSGWGGGYAIYFQGPWYVSETALGGGDAFTTTRASLGGEAKGNSSGWFFSNVTQSGFKWKCNSWTIGPFGSLQYSLAGTKGFSESGSLVPVTVRSTTNGSLTSDAGLELTYDWSALTFKVSGAWEHEYLDTTSFSVVNIVDIPASVRTVSSPSLGHDSAVINCGVSYHMNHRAQISLGYLGQYGRKNEESNSVTASIRFSF